MNINKTKTILFTFIALCVLLPVAYGEEVSDFSIEWVDSSSFPVCTVYYSTVDASGNPAGALWVPDQVSVWENGVEHRSGNFEDGDHAPAYLSLIIDSSGSMEGSLEEVLKAARKLIDQFDSRDRAEVIDFDSKVVTRRSFTDSKEEMIGALDDIEVGGGTALYDALAVGFDHLRFKEGMKTVLVLSDGEDENSREYGFADLKERLETEGVRVFTIALGEGVDTATMTEIAGLSDGSFYHAASADDVEGIYREIITYLHSLHRLWYSSSFGMFDGTERKLTVEAHEPGTRHDARYTAPTGKYWSHAILLRRDDNAAPVRISPGGDYISQVRYRALLTSEGRRLTEEDWGELYDASMTEHYVCGYVHSKYGRLDEYDPEKRIYREVDTNTIIGGASGSFHSDWDWYPKAISPYENYIVFCASPEQETDYDYYFLLYDRRINQVEWENGFFKGEFDEPGPMSVADDGSAVIVQDANLFMVGPDGELRYALEWKDTGRRWSRLDISSDGNLVLGRDTNDNRVWLYSGDGKLLWEKPSECSEEGGFLALSPNGKYAAFADSLGPHVFDVAGTSLFELQDTDFGLEKREMRNGIDIADNGSFVYTIGNRFYYRKLE